MAYGNKNVWGTKPKQTMHTSSKHLRPKPQGRGKFTHRLTAEERAALILLSAPGRRLTVEQERRLMYLKRKAK